MSRKNWLYLLIPLSAVTALAQYAMQGAMAGPGDPTEFKQWFWSVDYSLWALRAIIEAAVIVYLFQTVGTNRTEKAILTILEVSLIALIAVTLGLAFRAIGYDQDMLKSLGEPWFTIWTIFIAAYTPLMMGSVGYAYKVQPIDKAYEQDEDSLDKDVSTPSTTEQRRRNLVGILVDTPNAPVSSLAERLDTTRTTIYNDLKRLVKEGAIRKNGDGYIVKEIDTTG